MAFRKGGVTGVYEIRWAGGKALCPFLSGVGARWGGRASRLGGETLRSEAVTAREHGDGMTGL